jgi:glutamate dehydrogenase (NAD(P)+)
MIAAATLEKNDEKIKGARVAIQGFGNVGRFAALACQELGFKVIAISDVTGGIVDRNGIDIHEIVSYTKVSEIPSYELIDPKETLEQRCEVLIPAALGGVINSGNAAKIKAEYIVEGANQPTTADADVELRGRGVTVVPDILANAGGVMGSYFEWTQNIQQFSWPIEKFRKELDARMSKAFGEVHKESKKHSVDMRMAAFILAVKRVSAAHKMRGELI